MIKLLVLLLGTRILLVDLLRAGHVLGAGVVVVLRAGLLLGRRLLLLLLLLLPALRQLVQEGVGGGSKRLRRSLSREGRPIGGRGGRGARRDLARLPVQQNFEGEKG